MHQSYATLTLLCVALFYGSGTEANIQCFDCVWTNPDTPDSVASCRYTPSNIYLIEFASPVNGPDSTKAGGSSNLFQVISDTLVAAANKGTNATLPEITHSPTGEQELQALYTVVCLKMTLELRIQGQSADMIFRGSYPLRMPENFVGKCLDSFPPLLEEELGPELVSYITSSNFCYCDTNGCNTDALQYSTPPPPTPPTAPTPSPCSGVKPTFSALAALLSLFLIKYVS